MAPLPQTQAAASTSANPSTKTDKPTNYLPLIVAAVVLGVAITGIAVFSAYFYGRIGVEKVKQRAHAIRQAWDEKARQRATAREESRRIQEEQKQEAFEEEINKALAGSVHRQIPGDTSYVGASCTPGLSQAASKSVRGGNTPPSAAETEVKKTATPAIGRCIPMPKRVYYRRELEQEDYPVVRFTPLPAPLDPVGWVGFAAGVPFMGYPEL